MTEENKKIEEMPDLSKMPFDERREWLYTRAEELRDQRWKQRKKDEIIEEKNSTGWRGFWRWLTGRAEAARKQRSFEDWVVNDLYPIRGSRVWFKVFTKSDDGMIFATNITSVKGKNEKEIVEIQNVLRKFGIETELKTMGSFSNKNIDEGDVLIFEPFSYDDKIRKDRGLHENDPILYVKDPMSNLNLVDFGRSSYWDGKYDDRHVPVTRQEFDDKIKRERERQQKAIEQWLRMPLIMTSERPYWSFRSANPKQPAASNNLPLSGTKTVKDPELTFSDFNLESQEPSKFIGVGGKVDNSMTDLSYPPHAEEVTNLGGGKITLSDTRDVALRVEEENKVADTWEKAADERDKQFGPDNLTLPEKKTTDTDPITGLPSESKEEVKLEPDPYAVARMREREGSK